MSEAIVYYSARPNASLGTLFGTTFAVWSVQSALLLASGFFIVSAYFPRYGASVTRAEELYLLFIPLWLASLYLSAFLNGQQRFREFNVLRVLPIILTAVGLAGFAVQHRLTVTSAVATYLAANLGAAMVAMIFVSRLGLGPIRMTSCVVRRLLGYGLRSHSATVSSLANERLDQLVISLLLAPASLGLYVIAGTLTAVTGLVGFSVAMVAVPALARLEPGEQRLKVAQRLVTLTLAVSAIVTLPLIAFTSPLIRLFFGSAYLPATNAARVLLVAAVILSTNRVLTAVLRGTNRPFDAGIGELLGVVATVGAIALLLPAFGIMGAAVASIIAYTISTGWMAWRATQALDGPLLITSWPRTLYRFVGGAKQRTDARK